MKVENFRNELHTFLGLPSLWIYRNIVDRIVCYVRLTNWAAVAIEMSPMNQRAAARHGNAIQSSRPLHARSDLERCAPAVGTLCSVRCIFDNLPICCSSCCTYTHVRHQSYSDIIRPLSGFTILIAAPLVSYSFKSDLLYS